MKAIDEKRIGDDIVDKHTSCICSAPAGVWWVPLDEPYRVVTTGGNPAYHID